MKKTKKVSKKPLITTITGCEFNAIKYDADVTEVMKIVATALLNMTKVFTSPNVEVHSLLKVGTNENGEANIGVSNSENK